MTGGWRDGCDSRRVARPTVPLGSGSWSRHQPHEALTPRARRHHFFIVGDPGGERGSPQSSRLTSASPAGSPRRLRQRRSCRESTSRSPGARRSARYLLRAVPTTGATGDVTWSELLGAEHTGQEHGGHQPRALLVLGQRPQAVALEQHPQVRLDRVDGEVDLRRDLAVGRRRRGVGGLDRPAQRDSTLRCIGDSGRTGARSRLETVESPVLTTGSRKTISRVTARDPVMVDQTPPPKGPGLVDE